MAREHKGTKHDPAPHDERCSYVWERRTPGARYVNARGQCPAYGTAPCGRFERPRCSQHCAQYDCKHQERRRRR